jgi:hypothetical protein
LDLVYGLELFTLSLCRTQYKLWVYSSTVNLGGTPKEHTKGVPPKGQDQWVQRRGGGGGSVKTEVGEGGVGGGGREGHGNCWDHV